MLDKVKNFTIAGLLRCAYGLWSFTWRVVKWDAPQVTPPVIYAHWHGDELALIGPFSGKGMAVLVSRSRDGEMLSRWLGWIGYWVVRGSSSRDAVGGLKGLVDAVRDQGKSASLAVDGPRGPRGVVKAGVIKLAQITGRPIVPGVAVCRRAWKFPKTWNQCFLPFPFSRILVQYGDPISVSASADVRDLEVHRVALEQSLHQLKARAESRLNAPDAVRASAQV
jgi:lysophospholipid acyltransferase (LPLAT)-like uncharacterized protein